MAISNHRGGVGDLRYPGALALIPGRTHNGPDENEAADKLPTSGRA